jgi:Fe2+ or Zn2+ uptake regulation protein
MKKYIEILKQNSIKVTPQRLAMVSLMDQHGHISVNEIYESIKKSFPTLSLATVYKNINSMVQSSFIKELKIVGYDAKYELVKEEHSHLICKECGSVEDIFLKTDTIVSDAQNSGYDIQEVTVQLKGICQNCQ